LSQTGLASRQYHYPSLAPVTGYYSLRYGTDGLEARFDARLRGQNRQSELARLLHRPPQGLPVTITINLPAQEQAAASLAEIGTSGAVLALDSRTGAVRVLVSHPSFDPNQINQTWGDLLANPQAPLLNRATQGIFALGDMFGLIEQLHHAEGHATLDETVTQLGLLAEPSFTLPSAPGLLPSDWPAKAPELGLTPLHLGLIGAALSQEGLAPRPTLILSETERVASVRLFSLETAASVHRAAFNGLARPDVTGNETLAWSLYLTPTTADTPSQVIVVVLALPPGESTARLAVALGEAVAGELAGN
jgi:hypothetical protein